MCDTDWCFVNEFEDANLANDPFVEKYKGIFDICFPFKNVKEKELTKITKPWILRDYSNQQIKRTSCTNDNNNNNN